MTIFLPDTLVDITIHGALVDHHGDHTLTVTIPGWPDPIEIPLVDQDGGPMPAVKILRGDVISSVLPPVGAHRAPESVEAAHAAGNHWGCSVSGCRIDHERFIPLGGDELLGGGR